MKILFANPPTFAGTGKFNRPIRFPTFNYATPVIHPPILLAYAAAYVRSRGHDVVFIDAEVDSLGVDEFVAMVGGHRPDLAVFETSTASFSNDIAVAERVKQQAGGKIVFCGSHVSALPEKSMEAGVLDAVIFGEYETSLGEYIEKGGRGTAGICYRDNGRVVLNPPRKYETALDDFPFPARDLMANEKYFDPILKQPFTFVLSGRGCPYQCVFCNWPQVMTGHGYRLRSAKNIVDELEVLQREYRLESFLFNDDCFTSNKKHAMDVCDEMMRRGIRMPWACYARADEDDRELLEKLKEAGCWLLKVGIESGDQTILDNVKKKYRIDKVRNGIKTMKSVGLDVHGTFVFGLPGETAETIKKTIKYSQSLHADTVQFSTAVPYPGTELYQYFKDEGFLLTEDWDNYMPMMPIFGYPHLSAEEIKNAVGRAYRGYYFRPSFILNNGVKALVSNPVQTWSNFKKLVKMAF